MLQILTLVTLLVTLISGPISSGPADPKTISIAEARSLPLGTIVTIDGVVTVPSGAFSSSTFDQGFAIQDRTGGIYVSVPDNLGFTLRQQVRVVDVTDVKAHGSGPKVRPLPVATGDVGEDTEGQLVTITGTITQPVIFINDGSGEVHSFVCASTGIDVSGLSPGQTIEVTGFSGQFADDFEVDPRTQSDIRIVNNEPQKGTKVT
jgi:DNA/RNA endonuclease YhcR with UshA esterase domain